MTEDLYTKKIEKLTQADAERAYQHFLELESKRRREFYSGTAVLSIGVGAGVTALLAIVGMSYTLVTFIATAVFIAALFAAGCYAGFTFGCEVIHYKAKK